MSTNSDLNLLEHTFSSLSPLFEPLKINLFTVGGVPINSFDLIEFVIIFIVTYFLGKAAEASITRIGKHRGSQVRMESLQMFAKFVHWAILCAGLMFGFAAIGLPVTHLAILVSALSVGIGFGLQTIVNNSIAGLILITEKAVSVGDVICTPSGHIGKVNMITIRATRIVTPIGEDIIVPNANLIDKPFTNYTLNPRGVRKIFPFSVAYGIDFRKVKEIIENAATQVPFCIKPDQYHEVECGITGFGNFGINVELVVWVDPIELMEPYRLKAAFLNAINDACVANGIIMPGPSYAVSVTPATSNNAPSVSAKATHSTPPPHLTDPNTDSATPYPAQAPQIISHPSLTLGANQQRDAAVVGLPQSMFDSPQTPKKQKGSSGGEEE